MSQRKTHWVDIGSVVSKSVDDNKLYWNHSTSGPSPLSKDPCLLPILSLHMWFRAYCIKCSLVCMFRNSWFRIGLYIPIPASATRPWKYLPIFPSLQVLVVCHRIQRIHLPQASEAAFQIVDECPRSIRQDSSFAFACTEMHIMLNQWSLICVLVIKCCFLN